MNIIIENTRLRYNIEIHERISFLYDKSGTGKTKLCNIIEAEDDYDVNIITESNDNDYEVIAVIHSKGIKKLSNTLSVGRQIVIIDEDASDSSSLYFEDVYSLCEEKDNYVIIISRDSRIDYINKNQLLYSFHTVKDDREYITIEPPTYNFYNGEDIDVLVCEDSSLGLTTISDSMGMVGCSSNGNSNMINIMENHISQKESSNKSIGYVVDGSVFTGYYIDIIKMLKTNGKITNKISLFMPPSFEYLVIKSSKLCNIVDSMFLDINYVKANIGTTIESIGFKINEHNTASPEVYYTELLKYMMKKKFKFNYDKSKRFPYELELDLNKFKQELYNWKNCYWLPKGNSITIDSKLLSPNEFIDKFS